jgi:hypothetical protein
MTYRSEHCEREGESAADGSQHSAVANVDSHKKVGDVHPVIAPLAWIICFLLGAAFWITIISLALYR